MTRARLLWPKPLGTGLPLAGLMVLAACAPVPQPAAPAGPPPAEEAPPPEAASAPSAPNAASTDQDFINQALGMGQSEIGMGRLAQGKGAAKEIRALAARMVAGHTFANRRLEILAKHLRLEVAPPPDEPPPALLTSMGPEFDKRYLGLVTAAHQNMIALFEGEVNNGQNPHLKHLARMMLPELRFYLHEAETIEHKIGT